MSTALMDFALKLEKDIRTRGLEPGSRYLTADESARLLGTSTTTANRVLKILAEKDVVVRRRNAGTFVGPAAVSPQTAQSFEVGILLPAAYRTVAAIRLDLIIEGVLVNMDDIAEVRTSYVPSDKGVDFVRAALGPSFQSGKLAGVLAISCPRDVYSFLGGGDYPLLVYGSLYSDQCYPSIDTDEREAGRLLTEFLIGQGHTRIAMFSATENCPGDSYFRDGATDALAAAGLPANALLLRLPGSDPEMLKAQVRDVLAMPNRPTGFIVNQPRWADEVAATVKTLGLRVPDDIQVVFSGFPVGEPGMSQFPHARPKLTYRQMGLAIGQMLAKVRQREIDGDQSVRIPYELCQEPYMGAVG
jgi:hypothetical protein